MYSPRFGDDLCQFETVEYFPIEQLDPGQASEVFLTVFVSRSWWVMPRNNIISNIFIDRFKTQFDSTKLCPINIKNDLYLTSSRVYITEAPLKWIA
mgnify:FL=1